MTQSQKHIDTFEEAVKTYLCTEEHDRHEVVALSSKGLALHYALRAMGVRRCDMVCMPSFASEGILREVLRLGAIPVFVGAEGDTWNMSHDLLEDAIKGMSSIAHIRPKAVIMDSACGMPSVVHRICEVCFRFNVPLIDYSCNALGAVYYGRKMGTFGQHGYGIVSFEEGNVVSCGGAALVCGDREGKMRVMDLMAKHRNARMSAPCAASGLTQLQDVDKRVAHNRHIQSIYEGLLRDVDGIDIHSPFRTNCSDGASSGIESNYQYSTFTTNPNICNLTGLQKRLADAGIKAQLLFKPLHTYLEYKDYPIYTNGVCEDLYKRGLCLPSGLNMTTDDAIHIVEKMKDVICRV